MKRIILDVDTGIDDALAIIYAMKAKDINIEGITTGYGNVHADLATENTLKVMDLVDPNHTIPVYQGAEKPLVRSMFPPVTHKMAWAKQICLKQIQKSKINMPLTLLLKLCINIQMKSRWFL